MSVTGKLDSFIICRDSPTKLIPVPTFEWNGFIVIYHLSENHSVILKNVMIEVKCIKIAIFSIDFFVFENISIH